MIGSRADTSKAEDTMRIQAFTVNGEAQLEKPVLKVEEPEYAWYLNEDCVFPAATAKDGTFGTDLSEKVEVFVVDSEGNAEKVTGAYRFAEAGLYRLKYRVSDEYGNITVKSFAISCAPAKTTENPVLTVSGYDDGAELTAEAMSEFTLPAVAECKDSNGEDISQRLSVAVTGPVTASLEDGGKFIPYAAGEYAIVYSVSDYTGKETTLTLKLSVTAPADCAGNQVVKNPDAFAVNNSEVRGGGIYLNSSGSFTYTGQMIYEEKVSMLLDWTIASSHEISDLGGVWDGAYLTMINMRGGASLNKVPSATSEWPTGFIILIDPYDHLTIQPAGHQTGILARLKFDNLREAFYGKEVLLQYQITDIVNEDGSLDRYCIQLWINGVRVGSAELPWTYTSWADSEGNFVIRARQASVYQNLSKAGWLNVTTYCGDDKTGRPNIVKWLSVDGVYVDSKLNVSGGKFTREQVNWLTEDLARANADEKTAWNVILMHEGIVRPISQEPSYTNHSAANRKELMKIFRDGKVDLVLYGHDHFHATSYPLDFLDDDKTDLDKDGYADYIRKISAERKTEKNEKGEEIVFYEGYRSGEQGTVFHEVGSANRQFNATFHHDTEEADKEKWVYHDSLKSGGSNRLFGDSKAYAFYDYVEVTENIITVRSYALNYEDWCGEKIGGKFIYGFRLCK